jgi:hypothetical protein
MPNRNFWNRSLPRFEYDHRARDARRRLEHAERVLANRDAAGSSRYFGLLRLLIGNVAGSARRQGQRTGSPNNRRPCDIIETPWPTPLTPMRVA